MEKIITAIRRTHWLQRWAGSYTFISCSYWGPQYYHVLKKILHKGFDHTLFIHKKGTATFYIANEEFRKLGTHLANKSMRDRKFAENFTSLLKKNTDLLTPLMRKYEGKIPSWGEYQKFLPIFERHLAYHVFVKKTVDFLSPRSLERLLPLFKDARLHSEHVYSSSETFFRNIMNRIAVKERCNKNFLTCLSQNEFECYLKTGVLPEKNILKARWSASALYFEGGTANILTGKDVAKIEKILAQAASHKKTSITGISGYPGVVKGIVRVVPDPFKVKKFDSGNILVTGMTRPEFLPLIKKSAAIITEAGGILCHAAITARELKIPCVVGTQIATKILKDGQKIQVDAAKGIVKIIK